MEWILGLDTSSTELGIGLYRDAKPAVSYSRYLRNSHAEDIARAFNFILKENGIEASDIDFTSIAVGPGSFTGLRIGIAFLKGLFLGLEKKVLPLSSLEVIAAGCNVHDRPVSVVLDARRGHVYFARFILENGVFRRLTEDALLSVDSYVSSIDSRDYVVTDRMGFVRSRAFDIIPENIEVHPLESEPSSRGMACARLALLNKKNEKIWRFASDIFPDYYQPPQQQIKGKKSTLKENTD